MKFKKILIASVNPDPACIFAEFNIINNIENGNKIYSVNVNKILNHVHPEANLKDNIFEFIECKFKRFISRYTNELKVKNIFSNKLIPILPSEINEIRLYKINGISVGLSALSTAASFSKCTSSKTEYYGKYLNEAWCIAHKSYELGMHLLQYDFDEVYIFNGRHAISRPLAEVLKSLGGVKVLYYEFDYTREKFTLSEAGFHDNKYLAKIINETIVPKKDIKNYFEEIRSGRVNSEYKKIQDSFIKETKLIHDNGIRWVTFFTSSADEFFANKDSDVITNNFKNQYEIALFLSTIQLKCDFRLIIRMHPHLQFKHPSWRNEWIFDDLIKNHVYIFYPNDSLSSYKLLEISSCIVTVGSSIGLESIERGIPCLEIGNTIGVNMKITINGDNLFKIEDFIKNPWMDIKSREGIEKYNSYQVNPPFKDLYNKKGVLMKTREIEKIVSPFRSQIRIVKKILIDNKIYAFIFNHTLRIRCKKIITEIDSQMPLKGEISKKGYIFKSPDESKAKFTSFSEFLPNTSIKINERHLNDFNKLFDEVMPEAVAYLGDGIIIDSITVTRINSDSYESVSANWHTDNVGHNLKVYYCIEGDGSIVTKYMPGTNNKKYKINIIEDLRLIGMKNRKINNGEIEIMHETGSLAIFDTNGLHRGGYTKNEKSTRIVLEIEISNKIKTQKLVGYAPIGVRSGNNTFYIDRSFYENFKYKKLFDTERIRNHNKNLLIYGGTPSNYDLY